MKKDKPSQSAVAKVRTARGFLGGRIFSLSIVLLLGLLGLILALGWVSSSSAYEDEGEIDVSFTISHDRPAYRVVVEGNHIGVKYYGGKIVEGEETACRAARGFDLVPSTTWPASSEKKIFHEYTENDKLFYINDKYDYICFRVQWGVWAGGANSGISYGPYRMGSDVTAANYDDLLQEEDNNGILQPDPDPVVQPVVVAPDPVVQPVVVAPDPVVQPVVVAPDPVVQPVVVAPDPVVQPVVVAPDPVVQPVVVAPDPVVQPVVVAPDPVVQPVVVAPDPVVQPVVVAPDPVVQPVVVAPDPVVQPVVVAPEPEEDTVSRQSNVVGSVNSQSASDNSDAGDAADQQQLIATTTSLSEEAEIAGVAGDSGNIPETGIIEKQDWWQLSGFFIISFAILGSARILILKKKHHKI